MRILIALVFAIFLHFVACSQAPKVTGVTATQSSTAGSYTADQALKVNGDCDGDGFSHTENEWTPWLQVDLGSIHKVEQVSVQVRLQWIQYIKVYVKNENGRFLCGSRNMTGGETRDFYCNSVSNNARYVVVERDNYAETDHRYKPEAMCLCLVEVFGRKILCPPRPNVGAGVQISSNRREPGSKVTFSCPPHHTPSGASGATCNNNGEWELNGAIPSCTKITCTAPQPLRHGSFSPISGEYTPTNQVTYTCNEKYKLSGGSTATCGSDGRWDFQGQGRPSCTEIQCERLQLNRYMSVTGVGRTLGSTRSFACTHGYQLVGLSSIKCEMDGTSAKWSGAVPSCTKKSCPVPNIENGEVLGTDYSHGASVSYKCYPGYTLDGSESRTCHGTVWSGDAPTCKRVSCRDPGVPDNGAKNGDDYSYGQTVSYTCNAGYRVSGPTEITCEESGTWTARRPTCEPLECPPVRAPRYGAKDGDLFEFGESVTYSCFPGYALVGSNRATCQADKTWSNPQPTCTPCPVGQYKDSSEKDACEKCPVHSTTITEASTSKQHCQCIEGTTGELGGPCTVVKCTQLVAPENGELVDPTCGTSINSKCEFACNSGYYLRGGPKFRVCTADGWSGNDVQCSVCPANTYTVHKGAQSCTPCPRNTVTNGALGTTRESCTCAPGLKGVPGGPCLDIDECMDENEETKVCEQNCHNTFGSYFCKCNIPGYVLADDKKSCIMNQTCPTLDQKPGNGNASCKYTESTNGHLCSISCNPGYFFVSGENNYVTCGSDTAFKWSHRVNNATARIPSCTKEFFVDVNLPYTGTYILGGACANNPMKKAEFENVIESAVNTIQSCHEKCDVSNVQMSCSGNKVAYKFDIVFPNVRPNEVGPNCTTNCKQQNLRDVLTSAKGMTVSLQSLVTSQPGSFQLQQEGAPTLESGTFKISGRPTLLCEEGKVYTKTRLCVPCDRGFYMKERKAEYCEPCDYGYYQDKQGQTRCKKCYEGSSTLQKGADHPTMCNKRVDVNNQ